MLSALRLRLFLTFRIFKLLTLIRSQDPSRQLQIANENLHKILFDNIYFPDVNMVFLTLLRDLQK